jgi:hypothetical protein
VLCLKPPPKIIFKIVRYKVFISIVYRFIVFIYFNLEFLGEENQGQGRYEGNVRSEVRFSEDLLLLYFSGLLLFNFIKIPSISRIQILRHIPSFKLTSEYIEYIL